MFIYIKHGDNEQFLANTSCPVAVLLQYLRSRLGLPESELLDLCDDRGVLKLLFLSQQPQESCSPLLPTRSSFTVCSINRGQKDGAYISITPLVASPDPALLEILQSQADSLEKARLRQLRSQEERRSTDTQNQAPPTQQVKGRSRVVYVEAPDEEPQRRLVGRRNRH